MAEIALWNGDICDLEVDAIVSPATTSLWMATGVAGAIKRQGGAIVTGAGSLAARWVIHAVSIDNARRTDSATIDRAVRNAFARARELGVETLAIPALGTGVGGFPIAEGARVTVAAIRSELARSPRLTRVTLALRGAASYEAFRLALAAAAEPPAGISA